ncbi:unnamed protein product [Lymnaea stagnalis]|uniref:Transforming acidic coiled-coil-containing protein C-terminal domain-containing protein n=1 Tax=Lymnaea stagnalis TaxID=6523 RepID=A0AAV2HQH7_LYMST
MADEIEEPLPSSPPLPKKGSYQIDFDTLDDTVNPFQPKVKLGSSPPIKVGNVAPKFGDPDDCIDPFKPKVKLASSPPSSPKARTYNNNIEDGSDLQSTSILKDIPDDVDNITNNAHPSVNKSLDQLVDSEIKSPGIPKPKKIVKKSKIQSKLKLPKTGKLPQSSNDEIQIFMPGVNENNSKTADDPEATNNLQSPQSKLFIKKKDSLNGEGSSTAEGDLTRSDEKEFIDSSNGEMPSFSAPDAMASSSEIDPQFIERDDMYETNEGFNPRVEAFDNCKEWDPLSKSPKEKDKALKSKDGSSLMETDSPITPFKEKVVKQSPSRQQSSKAHIPRDDDLLGMSTPPQGKQPESVKHPASVALEAAQRDSSFKGADSKNESSSEESQFYDAYDYPPVATTKSKLGQKNSTTMDRGPNHEEGGENKETVVQLVQDRPHFALRRVLRYSQSDWNKMKQEMELNFQASLLNKERDWSFLLGERDKKIAALEEANLKLKHTNEDMRMVVAEFEKTISQQQAEKEKNKTDSQKALQNLENERDQAIEDLQSVETAFSDLHRRYEKSKSIIEGFKRNEEQLKQCVDDLQNKLKKAESKLQALRSQAEEKLDKANEDIEKIKKSTKQDIVRLEAALKKSELRTSNLEESLQRKEKENQELTAICDELIAKVGS